MKIELYLCVALGVFISIMLPLLRALLPRPKAAALARKKISYGTRVWNFVKPYVYTGIFSLVVAILILAIFGDTIDTWQKSLLAGYTADSTLQKLTSSRAEV